MHRIGLFFTSFSLATIVFTCGLSAEETKTASEAKANEKPVTLVVKLPAPAVLELAGQKVESSGAERRFTIPPVAIDKKTSYPVKATWSIGGKNQTAEMTIHITGGTVHEVNLGGSVGQTHEQEVLRLCNAERARYGLSPLVLNEQLCQAARNHSSTMASYNMMSHGINGSFASRSMAAGYTGSPCSENVAMGAGSPADVVNMWMNSSGHRANILSSGINELGVGQAGSYWTQVFGRR